MDPESLYIGATLRRGLGFIGGGGMHPRSLGCFSVEAVRSKSELKLSKPMPDMVNWKLGGAKLDVDLKQESDWSISSGMAIDEPWSADAAAAIGVTKTTGCWED